MRKKWSFIALTLFIAAAFCAGSLPWFPIGKTIPFSGMQAPVLTGAPSAAPSISTGGDKEAGQVRAPGSGPRGLIPKTAAGRLQSEKRVITAGITLRLRVASLRI